MSKSRSHRLSKRNRYLAWGATGVVVAAGGAFAATNASATTVWPAQKTFTGRAFDACTAPSASAMKAWRTGFYGAAAVYVGGKNRGCTQANLTASWVKTVTAQGWKLVPLYVGAQPPCQTGTRSEKMTTTNAATLGAADGKDAVAKSAALGMKAYSAVYLDMEPYDIKNASCNKAVLSYVRAFDKALHDKMYRAGLLRLLQLQRRRDRHRHGPHQPAGQPLVRQVGQREHHHLRLAVEQVAVHEPQPRPSVHGQQQGVARRLLHHCRPRRLRRTRRDRRLTAGAAVTREPTNSTGSERMSRTKTRQGQAAARAGAARQAPSRATRGGSSRTG